jgi:hypothetical protein
VVTSDCVSFALPQKSKKVLSTNDTFEVVNKKLSELERMQSAISSRLSEVESQKESLAGVNQTDLRSQFEAKNQELVDVQSSLHALQVMPSSIQSRRCPF